jgi:hypothetical protein
MKTYTVIYAEDVPHYGVADIEASNDEEAVAAAKAYDCHALGLEAEWGNAFCHRIVEISDEEGRTVAHDLALDSCFIRYGGESERLLCNAAPELLAVLREVGQIDWVHNAAVTGDLEALRRICLQFADWWNRRACAAIAKAQGRTDTDGGAP